MDDKKSEIDEDRNITDLSKEVEELKFILEKTIKENFRLRRKLNELEYDLRLYKDSYAKYNSIINRLNEIKEISNILPKISKTEKNDLLWYDEERIYINKNHFVENIIEDNFAVSKSEKLKLFKIMSILESTEPFGFTKKVNINGKTKRMIVLNRYIIDEYLKWVR